MTVTFDYQSLKYKVTNFKHEDSYATKLNYLHIKNSKVIESSIYKKLTATDKTVNNVDFMIDSASLNDNTMNIPTITVNGIYNYQGDTFKFKETVAYDYNKDLYNSNDLKINDHSRNGLWSDLSKRSILWKNILSAANQNIAASDLYQLEETTTPEFVGKGDDKWNLVAANFAGYSKDGTNYSLTPFSVTMIYNYTTNLYSYSNFDSQQNAGHKLNNLNIKNSQVVENAIYKKLGVDSDAVPNISFIIDDKNTIDNTIVGTPSIGIQGIYNYNQNIFKFIGTVSYDYNQDSYSMNEVTNNNSSNGPWTDLSRKSNVWEVLLGAANKNLGSNDLLSLSQSSRASFVVGREDKWNLSMTTLSGYAKNDDNQEIIKFNATVVYNYRADSYKVIEFQNDPNYKDKLSHDEIAKSGIVKSGILNYTGLYETQVNNIKFTINSKINIEYPNIGKVNISGTYSKDMTHIGHFTVTISYDYLNDIYGWENFKLQGTYFDTMLSANAHAFIESFLKSQYPNSRFVGFNYWDSPNINVHLTSNTVTREINFGVWKSNVGLRGNGTITYNFTTDKYSYSYHRS